MRAIIVTSQGTVGRRGIVVYCGLHEWRRRQIFYLLYTTGNMRRSRNGRLLIRRRGSRFPFEQWAALLLQQDIIYLGEEHHNRFHIDAAMTVLRVAERRGTHTPALAMEMFGWDGQTALDQYVSGSGNEPPGIPGGTSGGDRTGVAQFEDYEPLVQLAKEHHWTVDAMNPPKPLVTDRRQERPGPSRDLIP